MSQPPLVSIGIPTYNRPEGLQRTLTSMLMQTHENLAILVADNGSPGDATREVVQQVAASDRRVVYCRHEPPRTMMDNFRFLLQEATGDFFLWAADDDEWSPDFIAVSPCGHGRRRLGHVYDGAASTRDRGAAKHAHARFGKRRESLVAAGGRIKSS